MSRVLVICAATVALTILLATAPTEQCVKPAVAAVAPAEALVPSCLHPSYGANGNMGPLFCVVDNPVALSHFAPMAQRTFALGSDPTPAQVTAALIGDYNHGGTGPVLCSIYRLAAWRGHWHFGVAIVAAVAERLNFPAQWCQEPSFHGVE